MPASSTDESVLAEARKRFKIAVDADSENRQNAIDDLKFAWDAQNQWGAAERRMRGNRPCLTENRLPQFIRQIVNTMRANRPSIHVSPVRNGSFEVAKVIEGVIRHTEQYSKADLAIDTAAEYAVASGLGYFRIMTEYLDDESFDQDIAWKPVENPFSVYDDPHYQMPDASDRKWCFVTEWLDRDDFEAKYPDVDAMSFSDPGAGDDANLWCDEKRVQVAEYWRVVTERATVTESQQQPQQPAYGAQPGGVQAGPPGAGGMPGMPGAAGVPNGGGVPGQSPMPVPQPTMPVPAVPSVPAVAAPKPRTREVERKKIEQYLLTGDKIIKRSDWAGRLIPVIPIFGECITIDGKKYRKSLIRDAKDPQKINNYWLSAETEAVALQPKAPIIGWVGQFETDKKKWASANTENHAYLQADVVSDAPPTLPQRQPPPQFPQAMRESRLAAIEAIKASMGIYDASLGARSNEVSGIAIEQRQEQGDMSTYHFPDNVVRALRYAALVIIDLLPRVYDQQRVVRMIDVDGTATQQAINTLFVDPATYQLQPMDVRVGCYDVVVKAGPSFQTQRQEAAKAIFDLIKAYPPVAQVAGDLLVKNLDFPGADEMADRIRTQMAQAQQQGIPPEIQQQMQGMQQTIAVGKQAFDELQQTSRMQELKLAQKDLEIQKREIALRDKSAVTDQKRLDSIDENQKWIVETLLEVLKLQQTQAQPIGPEAQQLEPTVRSLAQ